MLAGHLAGLCTHAGAGAGVVLNEGLHLFQQHAHGLPIAEAQGHHGSLLEGLLRCPAHCDH